MEILILNLKKDNMNLDDGIIILEKQKEDDKEQDEEKKEDEEKEIEYAAKVKGG